jgi:hypothetical protein
VLSQFPGVESRVGDKPVLSSELNSVLATGSPSEKVRNKVSKLLVNTWIGEEETGGMREVLCVVGVGWTNATKRDTVKLIATGDEEEAEKVELLLCETVNG